MQENPRIERALAFLMLYLDKEVPKGLFVTSAFDLEKDVVRDAEALLSRPRPAELQEDMDNAKRRVESALRSWLEAWDGWLQASGRGGE